VEKERVLAVSEHEAIMDGRVSFAEVKETFGIEDPDTPEEFDTLGGYVTHELGRLPRPGDSVVRDGVKFIVESVENRRVGRVRVIREPQRQEQHA
jgi:CBS domain containing-hemolysin-like protein